MPLWVARLPLLLLRLGRVGRRLAVRLDGALWRRQCTNCMSRDPVAGARFSRTGLDVWQPHDPRLVFSKPPVGSEPH
jgi:hypothetical protein